METSKSLLRNLKDKAVCTCGEWRPSLFEFAHYNREDKLNVNGKSVDMSSIKNKALIHEEIKKGRYLCIDCHREETCKENDLNIEKYIKFKVSRCLRLHRKKGVVCKGIVCEGRRLGKNNFKKNQNKCEDCVALEKIQRRKKKQLFIAKKKVENGCCAFCRKMCTHENYYQFEWDHIFGKNRSVSKLIDCFLATIENEIKLCRLLCLKCHRLKSIMESRGIWKDNPSDFIQVFDTY